MASAHTIPSTRRPAASMHHPAAAGVRVRRHDRGPRTRWAGDLRLLPAATAAWAAAALAVRSDPTAVTGAGMLAAIAGMVLAVLVCTVPGSRHPVALLVPALALAPVAALTLVLLAAGGSLSRAHVGPVHEAARSGIPFTAELRVTGEPSPLEPGTFGGDRYLVDAAVVGGVLRGKDFAAATPVVVIGATEWARVGTGDTVRVLGTAKPADRVGKAAAVFLPASQPILGEATGWLGYTGDLRDRFRELADRDGRDGGLLPGMALGDRIGLEPGLEESMRTTGLTHLTAVSGANCSYVIAFTFFGLRMVRLPRLPAGAGAVLALAGFVMLVRPEPSVLRAAVMGAIGVAAVLSGRGRVSLTLLMLSIVVLLTVDPWLSVSYAFVLSVAATLGLVTAGPMMVRSLEAVLPRSLAQLLAIPLTAQLFCTPVLVLIQPALPVYSLPANVLASPVVPAITLLGMIAVLALVAAPVLAPPLVAAAQCGTRWVAGVADTLAAAPAASLPWIPGVPGAVTAALSSLVLLLLMARQDALADRWTSGAGGGPAGHPPAPHLQEGRSGYDGGRDSGYRTPRRNRLTLFAAGFVLTAAVMVGILLIGRMTAPPRDDWVLAMCDVGQGDGIVIRTTPGHALVVDTGPDPDAMDRCLDDLQIGVIDALVVTHLHDDHYGGISGAIRGRQVAALYYSSGEDGLPPEVTAAAAAAGVEAEQVSSTTAVEVPPIEVDLLWPLPEAQPAEENNASAVLEVVVPTQDRPITLLLTGDLEEDAAAVLLSSIPALRDGRVDILKIAHHGARNGGSELIHAVNPGLALISVGEDNEYGHPHPSILDTLDSSGIPTARTDELGSFTVDIVDGTMEVRPRT